MDINTTTVAQLLANPAAVDALNSVEPAILKNPMVKLVKNKTIADVFKMVPDSKLSPEKKAAVREALEKV